MQNEIRLWRAVLDQVMADACMIPKDEDDEVYKIEATAWFESNDFDRVCELSFLDRDIIYRIYEHFYERSLNE